MTTKNPRIQKTQSNMNKRLSLTTMLAIVSFVSLVAQTTALVPYVGGYFVKNGDEWTEYRPADKTGKWSTYKQYKETTPSSM